MGMRRNISLDYGDNKIIYLFTHWGADGLENVLANALDKGRDRWNDDAYLARIIFTDMIKGADDLMGYGLSPYECDPQFKTLKVDLKNQTVNLFSYDEFINNPKMFKI